MQKVPSNQHPNITSTSPPNPQKYIQAYIIDYGKIIGKGNYSTVYPAINKNKPGLQLAVKIVNINNMRQQKI